LAGVAFEEDQKESDDRDQGLRFSPATGWDDDTERRRVAAQAGHQEFAGDDQGGHPSRSQVGDSERNQENGDEDLVGGGVEIDAEGRDEPAPASHLSVERVGEGGDHEKHGRSQLPVPATRNDSGIEAGG